MIVARVRLMLPSVSRRDWIIVETSPPRSIVRITMANIVSTSVIPEQGERFVKTRRRTDSVGVIVSRGSSISGANHLHFGFHCETSFAPTRVPGPLGPFGPVGGRLHSLSGTGFPGGRRQGPPQAPP